MVVLHMNLQGVELNNVIKRKQIVQLIQNIVCMYILLRKNALEKCLNANHYNHLMLLENAGEYANKDLP